MPGFDVAIDYELLNQLANDTDVLKDRLADSRLFGRESFYDAGSMGGAFPAVNHFFLAWLSPWENARTLLESLSGTYKVAALKMFEMDASLATQANVQAANFYHSMWEMNKKAYDDWKKLSETTILVHAWDKNGNEYLKQQRLADPNDPNAPKPPGYEPTGYEYTHDDGDGTNNVHNSSQTTYDSDGKLKSSDTTIDDGDGGLKYQEHTDYGDNNSYTTTITHTDGSKTVIEVQGDANGNGTRNVTNTDKDGKTTDTSSYSGSGLNTTDPKWTNNDPDATDTDGDGKNDKNDPGGSQYSNTGVGSQV